MSEASFILRETAQWRVKPKYFTSGINFHICSISMGLIEQGHEGVHDLMI